MRQDVNGADVSECRTARENFSRIIAHKTDSLGRLVH